MKLIPKGSATENATNPGNYRPIALTPCIGKIFTTLLRNRWLHYMTQNNYISTEGPYANCPRLYIQNIT